MRHLFRHNLAPITLGALSLLVASCNLAFDLDDFPYEGAQLVDMTPQPTDMPADMSPDMRDMKITPPTDMPDNGLPDLEDMRDMDDAPDMPDMPDMPEGPPQLIITELMIDTDDNGEHAEMLELYNAGATPLDLADFCISTTKNPLDEMPLVNNLQLGAPSYNNHPAITTPLAPGEYALFIKGPEDSSLEVRALAQNFEGVHILYFGSTLVLGNSDDRLLAIHHDPACFTPPFEQLRWNKDLKGSVPPPAEAPSGGGLASRANYSWALKPQAYSLEAGDALESWCLTERELLITTFDEMDMGTEMRSGLFASPGAAFDGDCAPMTPP